MPVPDPPTVAALRFPVTGYRSEGLADAEILRKLLGELGAKFSRLLRDDNGGQMYLDVEGKSNVVRVVPDSRMFKISAVAF